MVMILCLLSENRIMVKRLRKFKKYFMVIWENTKEKEGFIRQVKAIERYEDTLMITQNNCLCKHIVSE